MPTTRRQDERDSGPASPGGARVQDAATVQILTALARLDERLTQQEAATAERFAALEQAGQEVVAGVATLQQAAEVGAPPAEADGEPA